MDGGQPKARFNQIDPRKSAFEQDIRKSKKGKDKTEAANDETYRMRNKDNLLVHKRKSTAPSQGERKGKKQ